MNKLVLFFLLIGSLFITIGINNRGPVAVFPPASAPSATPRSNSVRAVGILSNRTTPQEATVTKVVDGDTIDVRLNGKEEKVRLIGINAPETNECFGNESTERAIELLGLKSVSLEADPSQGERDKYRRLLRYVFVNGMSFEEIMIREGFAKEYTYRTAYKYQSLFKSAQSDAQNNKRGLWADGACSSSNIEPKPSGNVQNIQGSYTCDCSKLCSQIATCDEAYYQLNQCGCSKRDSDRDGIPCESLCR